MDENRLRGLLGLSVRARTATFGMDGCLKSIRGGTCRLLLVDAAASQATLDKYLDACRSHGTEIRIVPEDLIEEATGHSGVAVALAQGGLTEQIMALQGLKRPGELKENQEENLCGGADFE